MDTMFPATMGPEQDGPATGPSVAADAPLPGVAYPTLPDRRAYCHGRLHGRWGVYPLLVHGAYAQGWMVGHSETRVAMPRCNRCGYGHARTADCR